MKTIMFKVFSVYAVMAMVIAVLPVQSAQAAGSISLTTLGVAYTQDFNTLANTPDNGLFSTVPTGWEFAESGTNANTTYRVGTGSNTTGDTYSFGTAGDTERAFGGLRSGSLVPLIGAQFTNNTGGIITSLDFAYTGEHWRLGQNTAGRAADRLDFQLSTDAATITTGIWTDYDSLDFSSPVITGPVGALNGNVSPNRTALSFSVTGLTIPNGTSFWIRWADTDLIPGSDDGLSVDDFSLTPQGATSPIALSVSDVSANEGNSGTTSFDFTVSLSLPAGMGGVTFDIAPQDDAASSPDDFTVVSLTGETIPEGSSTYNYSVIVNGDLVTEPDETFFVNVTNVYGATVLDGQGVGTIVNDDAGDGAPAVTATFPANGATNFPVGSDLNVTFSEPVNVTSSWFSLVCSSSGNVTTTFSGGPTDFTLNPGVVLVGGETCTLTVLANQVSDVDANDPPDDMVVDFVVGFSAYDICADYTPIYSIQGPGIAAAVIGTVSTKGVVVGDFEGTAAASGFYIQDLTGDGDPSTSDGIFVFTGSTNLVSVGQVVRVTGYARERFNQTTLNGSNSNTAAVPAANIVQCGSGSVAPVDVTLPVTNINDFESYEGMLVRFPQALVIAEYFNYDRFGEIVLAQPLLGETRPFTGTAIDLPGAPANNRTTQNTLSRITLDDFQSSQNPSMLRHPNGNLFSLANKFRGGDTVQNAVGVLGYDFNLYRIIPTGPADYTAANPRPAAPEPVGGTVRLAAMNTLNFFVTADYPSGILDNKCGPLNNVECRGWDSDQITEFTRQRDKLLAALSGLDADIIGLNEMENSTGVEPLANIVSGLPGYAYIATGPIGTDAIKVGMIYRSAVVTPVGDFKLLTSAVDPRFLDTKSRPSLAQTFEVNATGARFTVAVNHFKSKGSACDDVGDPDLVDGQGNCSQTRRAAAKALVDWLATDPTGSGDPDFIVMGDLNSYAQEDAIVEIKAGSDDTVGTSDDFTNLIYHFHGDYAYSYTFDGQAGYLDHALANASLLGQVTGATEWHINSDEPDVLDYDTSFKPAAQDALYEDNAYRTSDHDPVVVGLIPNAPPIVNAGGPYSVNEGSSVTVSGSGSDPNNDELTYAWDLDNNGSFETSGQSVSFSAVLLDGPSGPYTVRVKATDPLGLSSESTAIVNVLNVTPTVSALFASNSISCGPNNSTLNISFVDPAVADTHTALINWGDGNTQTVSPAISPFSLQHTYASAGTYTATVTVTDDDGGVGTTTAPVMVKFNTTGFQQPINADGTSVFKYNSTIPVKIGFKNCDGSTPGNLAPAIKVTMISGSTPGLVINEPISTSRADTTGVMRFSANKYIYNLATKPLPDPSATYLITVTIPYNGQTATVQFGLR